MYLEISPRRSGKTTRLCLAAKEYLLEKRSNVALIYAMNIPHAKFIEDYLLRILPCHPQARRLANRGRRINRDLKGISIPQNDLPADRFFLYTESKLSMTAAYATSSGSWIKVFADEFDFFDYDIPSDKHGYYVTTPKTTRTLGHKRLWLEGKRKDFLLDLVKMNGGKTEKFTPFVFENSIDTIFDFRPDYDAEFLGNWDG